MNPLQHKNRQHTLKLTNTHPGWEELATHHISDAVVYTFIEEHVLCVLSQQCKTPPCIRKQSYDSSHLFTETESITFKTLLALLMTADQAGVI